MPGSSQVRSSVAVLAALFALSRHGSAASLARQGVDDEHFRSLQQFFPVAADRLSRGEALLMTARTESDVEESIGLFDEGIAAAPSSELIRRRKCQALTVLGRHADAVKACGEALHARTVSGLALRATVGALMSGPERPDRARNRDGLCSREPRTAGAPERGVGLRRSVRHRRKAGRHSDARGLYPRTRPSRPGHQETKRARSFLSATQPGLGTAAAWLSLALSVVAAIGHALLRRRRAVPVAPALIAAVLAFPAGVHAAPEAVGAASAGRRRPSRRRFRRPVF